MMTHDLTTTAWPAPGFLRLAATGLLSLATLGPVHGQGLDNLERLGFFGTNFTRTDGFQSSTLSGMNEAGQVFGFSDRFQGTSLLGHIPWVFAAGPGTREIGLTNNEFTRNDGFQANAATELTEGGWLRGSAARFLGGATNLGQAAWVADASNAATTRVGLFDAEHTGGSFQFSAATFITSDGVSGGYSTRYGASAAINLGQSAWLAQPVAGVPVTQRVGFTSAAFTGTNGEQFSVIDRAVESGDVAGFSWRYAAGTGAFLGQHAWVSRWTSNSSGTVAVGFYDAEHTGSNGYQASEAQFLNISGEAAGYSERFSGGADAGRTAWVSAPGGATTQRVGFTGTNYTDTNGYRMSEVVGITDSGLVAGHSESYVGATPGQSAWVAAISNAATVRVGLTGGEFQSTSGRDVSFVLDLAESGVAIGGSQRFTGETDNGNAAWIANPSVGSYTTARIGLTNAEHTSASGFQQSVAEAMNASGRAIGYSLRYNGASSAGQSAWVATPGGTTTRVGLTNAASTSATGVQFSDADYVTSGGLVLGHSERYNGGNVLLGQGAWLAKTNGVSQQIGLTDATYTRNDGYQQSTITLVTDSGYAAGSAERFNGGALQLGVAGWIYQPLLDQTAELVFSTALSGEAFTQIQLLTETGLAAGFYTLYSGNVDMGQRAFAWLPEVGGFDLGAYIGPAQFSLLAQATAANLTNYLAGTGVPLGNPGQAVFAATAVPEPGTVALVALGLGLAVLCRRRLRRTHLHVVGLAAALATLLAAPARAADPVNFADWLAFHNVPAERQDPNADPDGDGFANALEYVLGTVPLVPDAPVALAPSLDTRNPDQAYFVYRQSDQSVGRATARVMTSGILGQWQPAAGTPVVLEDHEGYKVYGHPVSLDPNQFFTLEVRISAFALAGVRPSPSTLGGPGDVVFHIGTNVGSAWDGLPPLANVSVRTEAAPVSSTDPTPDTSKYPGAVGAARGSFTADLLQDYEARGARPPLRSWLGWFLWGDGTPPPGIKAGIHAPGDYGTYSGTDWDYFNYQWPKSTNAPDGGRSAGAWNPVRVDQQPLFLNPFTVNYNWAPGPFGYEAKPMKNFPLNTDYWQDKTIVRGVNLSSVNPFFYQYGDKLTASSVPAEWHQAWLYLAMRPLETTVVVPGNLRPDEVLQAGPWNLRPGGTNDPFPFPVWDRQASAEEQTPFSLKVDRVGDFDADLVYEAANPRSTNYYAANRYQRTPFSQPGKGNYLKMTVGQGLPYAWCEVNNSRYATFYNLIRANTSNSISNNLGTYAGMVAGGPWNVPGVTGVQFVLLYGDHVNPNQWYQEVPPWYFDTPSKQPGGFNPPPGPYTKKGGGTVTAPGQHNHTYTAVFYRTDTVKPVRLTTSTNAAGFNNGTDAQGNPFFYLDFVQPRGKNWFVVANVPPMRYYHTGVTADSRRVMDQAARDWANTLGQYAFNFPTSTKVSYAMDNMSESRSTFALGVQNPFAAAGRPGAAAMTVNPRQSVIALNPHQYQPITLGPDLTKTAQTEIVWNPLQTYDRDFPIPASAPPNANRSTPGTESRWNYWSLRGNLKPIITDSFTLAYPFQNFLPTLPPPDYSRQVPQTGIPSIIITDVGTGYNKITEAPTVTITDSSGKGFGASAQALVDVYRGEIQQVDVVSKGQGYPDGIPPQTVTVTISPPASAGGRQATAYAQVGGGQVLAIFMLDKGAGYSSVISVTQPGQNIDPPIIVPNFDGATGAMLPGLVNVVESGAGFDFSATNIQVSLFGTGTGAQFQVVKPGNIFQVNPPLGGTGSSGQYPSVDGNPPVVTVAIEPGTNGGVAQTATARMAKVPGGYQPTIINQGDYADGPSLTASFTDDSVPPKNVALQPVVGGGKVLGLGLAPNVAADFIINTPKDVVFAGGSPSTNAVARVYGTYSVNGANITAPLIGGYTSEVQVSFLSPDLSDPAVPSVVAPQIQFSIPTNGLITQTNLTIVNGGSGLNYQPVDYQVFGGSGFDAALQPVLDTNGGVRAVRILRPGSNYLPSLKLWFNQGGHTNTPAQADVVVTDGRITAVNVTAPGVGYNSSLSVVPIAPTYAGGPANPDPVLTDNPKGYPAKFTAVLSNGVITSFIQSMPPPGIPLGKYIPGTEGLATKSSPPALLWCTSLVPFARVNSPAYFFRGQVAPPATGVDEVVYNSIIAQYTKLTGKGLAPFNGAFLGSSAPDGYGLGNQLGASANFLGDMFSLQQSVATNTADYPNTPITSYALDAAKSPANSYEFPVFGQNNPFGGMTDALKSSVQAMQRAITLLFQNPPSENNPSPQSLANLWNMAYYSEYDEGTGRIVINPTATQPAWGVVSSVQNPAEVSPAQNATKTGLSKWEKGMLWSGFGVSDQWNDQHYFYGYYLSSAALAGIFDRAWEPSITSKPADLWVAPTQMGTAVDQLLLTLAYDPDNVALTSSLYTDPRMTYQKFAFFDQFNGHPWASGASPGSTTAVLDTTNPLGYWGAYGTLSDKYNGENENSVFEGIQAWSAAILWGAATDRKAVLDLGVYLFTSNLAAGDAYFLDKNYNQANSAMNKFSWVPVTTITSGDVINNGNNTGWPANTGYVEANPIAFYEAPEAFGGKASAGQSLTKKAELTLNNFFYAFPTGSRFIQAYPPTAWTLGMSRNSTYMRRWAGTTMRQEWTDARNSALYQPAEWLSMSMTAALSGVPYQPGDQPFPMTGTTPNTPLLNPYIDRLWSSWVTTTAAPGEFAARNPSILSTTVLTFLSSFKDYGAPDWTYLARATDAGGADANSSIVLTAAFTKRLTATSVETTFVAFNPGWETRHAVFYRLNPDGSRGTTPVTGATPLTIAPKRMVTHKVVFNAQ